jgi:hypothetical protein
MADIVDDFLGRLQQLVPDIPAEAAAKLEAGLRQSWGGTEPYVGKRPSCQTKVALLANGLRDRKPLRDVFAQAGVSRSAGYRLLNRR